ncbi:MAG: T9SS type A sorting domain-containing protein [Bacteroidales bacterium]
MKKSLLLFVAVLGFSTMTFAQIDTVIGFTFPVETGIDSLNANYGTSQNLGYDIRFESESAGSSDSVFLTNGATDFAATANSWEDGMNDKFFSIKFKTGSHKNLVLYAKLRSGGNNPGPKSFKVQYKVSSSGTWTDVSADTVTAANDWTTGVVDGWAIPSETWNASESVYIRFLSVTNTNSAGNTVDSLGLVKIDDIFVLGEDNTGLGENSLMNTSVFPNPASDVLNIENNESIAVMYILSTDGRVVSQISNPGQSIDISNLAAGHYMLRMISDDNSMKTQSLIVE